MLKNIREKKGITLIALVVTIIILIILAGISINLVLGENGIIKKAGEAKEATEQAQVNEEIATNELMDQWDTLVGQDTIKPGESGYKGGNYDDPYIPIGFIHTEGTWNAGYTIKDGSGNEFVWVPCVTDVKKIKDGDNVQLFKKTLPTTADAADQYFAYNTYNLQITGDENPANDIRTSVGKYGGFYVAKYEAGVPVDEDGNEINVTLATTTQKARSVFGATAWTNITRTNAITVAENMIDASSGVKSGLISGECWDTTLGWMVNTSENSKKEPNAGYDIDSTGNGWHSDVSNNNKTTTGKYPINNVYDMAGNIYEWTTENCVDAGNSTKVYRGSYYGSLYPAARRDDSADNESNNIGFRVVLYK